MVVATQTVPPSGHADFQGDDWEEEWVRPPTGRSGATPHSSPASLSASLFVPSELAVDSDDDDDAEEDGDLAEDSNAEMEDLGDSDELGLGDTDVETDHEWGGSSAWSFPLGPAAQVLIASTPRQPSEASVQALSRHPSCASLARSAPEESSAVSGLHLDATMTPPKLSQRCSAPSFEMGTPMKQENPESSWELPRLPLMFDLGKEEATESLVGEPAPQEVPEDRERRLLCDVLWASQPGWGPADLLAAERKLAKVGIDSVASLVAALRRDLDRHLAKVDKRGTLKLKVPNFLKEDAVCGLDGQLLEQGRLLCDVLWKSRPTWTPAMLAAAQRKLSMVGVCDLASLDRALSKGLNRRLRKAGLKTFSAETIAAVRRHMDAFFGRLGVEDKETAWMHSDNGVSKALLCEVLMEPHLRDVLAQSRPMWSALDLAAAERKLALIGISSVPSLRGALAGDLNKQLRAAGLKTFNRETVRELRRRLGVPMPRRAATKGSPRSD